MAAAAEPSESIEDLVASRRHRQQGDDDRAARHRVGRARQAAQALADLATGPEASAPEAGGIPVPAGAAAGSPQARVAVAFFKAGRKGDVAGVKRCVVSSRAGAPGLGLAAVFALRGESGAEGAAPAPAG